MSTLILHHYAISPFSEKIRVMLGYTQLDWQSVTTREMPPRALLSSLAGGYRKIPVGQIGADIFCDSRTIAREVAVLADKPKLALEHCSKAQQAYIQEVDLEVFFACAMAASTLAMGQKFIKALSAIDMARFVWDRFNLGRTASVKSMGLDAARRRVIEHLTKVESRLKQPFLFGKTPNHADFSTYHSLWFLHDLAESPLLNGHPETSAWMSRMRAFGHGNPSEISAQQAINIAKQNTPRSIPSAHRRNPQIGQSVQIAPADYAQTPTTGTLVGVTPHTWILARDQPETGLVHLHFPQQGFSLTAAAG